MSKKIKIGYIWFTYKGDEKLIVEAVRCARNTSDPSSPFLIIDDSNHMISRDVMKILTEKYNCEYEVSYYNRLGNLHGHDHLVNATRYYLEFSRKHDLDVIVKTDSDSMIFDEEWIRPLIDDPEAVIAGSFNANALYCYGSAYAIKSSALKALHEDCLKVPAHPSCFEDFEISSRLFRISGCNMRYAIRYNLGLQDKVLCIPLKEANESIRFSHFASIGYDQQTIPAQYLDSFKDQEAAMMKKINDAVEKDEEEEKTGK